jgi:roadblock/LC7 domain-containing protein
MRIATFLTLPLLGALIALPAPAPAQVNVTIQFGARLGPEIGVFAYSPERHGDWRTNYRRWTPVTLYDVNGHYYRTAVRGARPVLLYTYNNEYFLPPQDRAWIGLDKRYNYPRQPTPVDYGRARPYAPDAVPVDARHEIGVLGYALERAGDWRTNVRRWTPVTVYAVRGRYYSNNVAGSRPVMVYRYRNEYFLPPHDQAWVGFDRRFDYNRRPSDDDYVRARPRP